MPGLVGLITRMPRERAEAELLRMVAAIRHEDFYNTGVWTSEELGVYVGWTARRESFSDGMPLRNERGDAVLVFSGEEFPEPGTASRLRARGHQFDTAGPAYLIHSSEEDPAFPSGLNGRFHGLLANLSRGTATLFNDRYGMHRLYYHHAKEAFYFAVEAKAILAVRPELRQLDRRALGEWIACGCALENRTLFENIHLLPAAAKWTFRRGSLERTSRYFEPAEWETQEIEQPEPYYRQLREVFSNSLPRYFEPRQPIGMSLTGGLDTRMILAWRKPAAGVMPCYTFGSMFRDCRDVVIARQVAAARRQPHRVISVGTNFLARFSEYAKRTVYLTDGCAGVYRAPDLYVNEQARQIAPVRMTGNWGGEILRRVRAFKPVRPMTGLFEPELASSVQRAETTYAGLLEGHPLTFAAFRQGPWHHFGVLGLEETQLALRSPFLDNDFVRTIYRAPQTALANNDVCMRLIEDGDPALLRIPTDRRQSGSQADGARVSRSWLEFLFKAEYAYDYGMPQGVARIDHLFSRLHLERLFLGRHKFTHFRLWYRDQLSAYVRDMLLDARSLARPYAQKRAVEAIVRGHLGGTRNYTIEIHRLLTLELLHRLFLDTTLDARLTSGTISKLEAQLAEHTRRERAAEAAASLIV